MEWINLKWYDLLAIGLTAFAVIIAIWWIFGDSPSEIQIMWAILLSICGITIKNYRELGEIKASMHHSFGKVKDELRAIKSLLKTRGK